MKKKYIVLAVLLIVIFMGLLNFFGFFGGKPMYDAIEAGKVTYENLPGNLKSVLTTQDVDLILELEFQYQQKIGLVDSGNTSMPVEQVVVDGNKLNQFIIEEAKKSNKIYSNADIDEVLKAEEVYLQQIGAMKE